MRSSRLRRYGKRVFIVWLALEVLAVALALAFGSAWSQELLEAWTKPSLEQREKDAREYMEQEQPLPSVIPGGKPSPPPYTAPGPWDPPPDPGYYTDPALSKFATLVAMRKARIECPTWEEWGVDWVADEGTLGYTYADHWNFAVVGYHDGVSLCSAARSLAREGVPEEDGLYFDWDSKLALAALVVVHESYHLRRSWLSHNSERRTECKAIRHFKVTVQLLGGSPELAARLLPHGLRWHARIARPGTPYHDPRCVLPKP